MAAILKSDGTVEIVRDLVQPGDSRLSDARDPLAHAATHISGGSDEITSALNPRAYPVEGGLFADIPAPVLADEGRCYYATDEDTLYRVSASGVWEKAGAGDYAGLNGHPKIETDDIANRPGASVNEDGRLFYSLDEQDQGQLYVNGPGGAWLEAAAPYLIADKPFTDVVSQAADATNNTVTLADTDLVFDYDAASLYCVDIYALIRSAATTTGIGLAFNTSGSVSFAAVAFTHVLANTGTLTGGDAAADATQRGISSGVAASGVDILAIGKGLVKSSLTSGTARLQFASEVAASQVTFRGGSVLRAMKVA